MIQLSNNKTPIHHLLYFLKYYKTTKVFKAILFYFYRYIKRALLTSNTEKTIQVNGYNMFVIPNDKGISLELLLFKTHEPLTTKLTTKELRNGMVCVDIGSNIGYYALLESKIVGKNGKIFAIEPSPENFNYLNNNLKLQNFSNTETHQIAIGNQDGTAKLTVGNKSNHSKVITEYQTIPNGLDVISVPIKKLDTFVQEQNISKIDFVRMDVEGFELNVIEGMKNVLRKLRPMIQVEVHKKFLGAKNTKKLLEIFKDEGYDIKHYVPKDMEYPFIGNMKDVKNYDINTILEMIESDSLPDFFILFLKNQN